MTEQTFEYDEILDSLTIENPEALAKEAIIGSLDAGNLIFDIGTGGSFVRLEIDNASKVFKTTPSSLKEIKSAKIKAIIDNNLIYLIYTVFLNNREIERALMLSNQSLCIAS